MEKSCNATILFHCNFSFARPFTIQEYGDYKPVKLVVDYVAVSILLHALGHCSFEVHRANFPWSLNSYFAHLANCDVINITTGKLIIFNLYRKRFDALL